MNLESNPEDSGSESVDSKTSRREKKRNRKNKEKADQLGYTFEELSPSSPKNKADLSNEEKKLYKKIKSHLDERKEKLAQLAEEKGYGYKTANLMLLQGFCESLNKGIKKESYRCEVPEFFGIPSEAIKNFMKKELALDVDQSWQELIESTEMSNAKKFNEVLISKVFPTSFLQKAKNFEEEINHRFDDFINKSFKTKSISKKIVDNFSKSYLVAKNWLKGFI
jgi:hypothetical protein